MMHFCFTLPVIILVFLPFVSTLYNISTHQPDTEDAYNKYYDYDEFTQRLRDLARQFSHIASLSSIGRSLRGRELWVMRITTNPTTDTPGKPRFKYVGNVHGDEALSRQLLVYFIEYLLTNYGNDGRVIGIVNRTDVYIMPCMNPDSMEGSTEVDCEEINVDGPNAQRIDLNYGFPDTFGEFRVSEEDSPEASALMKWILQKKFILSGELHGGSISHQLAGVYSQSADEALLNFLATTYARSNPVMMKRRYKCPNYPTNNHRGDGTSIGMMRDFNYLRGGCFEVTFEISCCKYPATSELLTEWKNNRNALLSYMEKVHIGVRGYVVDSSSGLPLIDSSISVTGIDHNITTWKFGDYYRMLLPGRYDIMASFPGYFPMLVRRVPVVRGKATLLNFTLVQIDEEMTLPTYDLPVSTEDTSDLSPPPSVPPLDFQYKGYSDMGLFMGQLNANFPSVTRLLSMGQSVQGRILYVMEITANPDADEQGKPAILLVGIGHGSDDLAQEFLLNIAEYLCRNYGNINTITQLVNSTRIHIMPTMNPDDDHLTEQGSTQSQHLDNSFHSELRITSLHLMLPTVIEWIKARSYTLVSSFHTGSLGISYGDAYDFPENSLLATFYSKADPSLQEAQVCEEITDSTQWTYITLGSEVQTWIYLYTDALLMNFGLGCDPHPTPENLPAVWENNHGAVLQLLQQVNLAVRGTVMDAQDGTAIANAKITVQGSRHLVHTGMDGQFWRLLARGTYHITASAPGYIVVTQSITVQEEQEERLDFRLPHDPGWRFTNPEETEFQTLVEELSSGPNLEQLVLNLIPSGTLRYRPYADQSEFLHGLMFSFPKIARLHSLGQSWGFRNIWALEISNKPQAPKLGWPRIRFVSGVHGNSPVGTELLLEFAAVLCLNYGRDSTVTKLIDRSRILIVPCVNPDGRELAEEGQCYSTSGLGNDHDVDIDQDFIYDDVSLSFDGETRQPETHAMMELIQGGGFSLSVAMESGAVLVSYPYNRPDRPVQNEEMLRYIASVYTSNHPLMRLGNPGCEYGVESSVTSGILRGSEFNSHNGSMKDFSMDVGLCPEITVYTGCCLFPPEDQLQTLWLENRKSLFSMLLEVHKGLSGLVTERGGNAISGALITVNGSLHIHSDKDGYFHALLPPGTHTLQIQAEGFPKLLREVNVSTHQMADAIVLEFETDGHVLHHRVVFLAAITLTMVTLCSVVMWHFYMAKFSWIRDRIHRSHHSDLGMVAMTSEKAPLRDDFLDESESEDDSLFVNRQ